MKLHQLSVFLENRPGQLTVPCKALAEAGLNILTLSLADTHQFGILRLIVRDWEKARDVLDEAGCVVKATEVTAIEVPDRPGGLLDLLDVIEDAALNVEYMYAFTYRSEEKAIMVFRFEKPDEAIEKLQAAGVNLLSSVELYGRVES